MALSLTHFRFGTETGTEATHGWVADEDTNAILALDTTYFLRLNVQESNVQVYNNVANTFQYSKNGGPWTNLTVSSLVARAETRAIFGNGTNCTQRLCGTGTFESTASGCTTDGTSGGNSNDIARGDAAKRSYRFNFAAPISSRVTM